MPVRYRITREQPCLVAGVWFGLTLLLCQWAAAQPAHYVGDLACSSASCHGSPVARASEGRRSEGAARLWLGETTPILAHHRAIAGAGRKVHRPGDPHAHAWRRLLENRYQAMLRAASGPHDGSVDPAVAARCAACHDPLGLAHQAGRGIAFGEQTAQKEPIASHRGIGCETCHGPASHWLHLHYQAGISRRTLQSAGMIDTKDVLVRARLCSTCHVGSEQHDLDHDLLAVGHPPLRFELAAYHAAIRHPHWDDATRRREQPTYEVQLWAAGRLAAAEASLKLLAHRAQKAALRQAKTDDSLANKQLETPWPAWAEHNCLACHQSLRPMMAMAAGGADLHRQPGVAQTSEGGRSRLGLTRQRVPLQHWNRSLVPELVARLASPESAAATKFVTAYSELVYAMEAEWIPDPAEVARRAEATREALAQAVVASGGIASGPLSSGPGLTDLTVEDLLAVVEMVLSSRLDGSRSGHPPETRGCAMAEGRAPAWRPETDWEQACHVLFALAATRQALIDAATTGATGRVGQQERAAQGESVASSLGTGEEVRRAASMRRAAEILRMGPHPDWAAVLGAPEDRAADRALGQTVPDSGELWSQLAALHQALAAAARHLPATPHSPEVRP